MTWVRLIATMNTCRSSFLGVGGSDRTSIKSVLMRATNTLNGREHAGIGSHRSRSIPPMKSSRKAAESALG